MNDIDALKAVYNSIVSSKLKYSPVVWAMFCVK